MGALAPFFGIQATRFFCGEAPVARYLAAQLRARAVRQASRSAGV